MKITARYFFLSVGIIILIPMDLAVARGLGVTAPFKIIHFLFMLLACLLDVPSLAISFVKPRLGSLMILSSAGVSLAITAWIFIVGCGPTLRKDAALIFVFWGLKLFVGCGIRYTSIAMASPLKSHG